ncbi:unannotated protein [freshwater metagenome]|uniref:Unannotated protein n=1 Tax=freshwater metagenome TaxID=449393 RepID=A0A6J6ZYV9_9ZZZZ
MQTSGTRIAAIPNERTNGTGTKNSVASAIETLRPDMTTVRPAVFMVRMITSLMLSAGPSINSRLKRCKIRSE